MNLAYTLVLVFALIGVLDTLYLIYHKVKGTEVACIFFPKEWCRKVQYSSYSKTFGIPNSVAGFVMYALILILLYASLSGVAVLGIMKAIVLIGFLFSLYFMFIQGFVLRAFCTWCVLSFVNFTVMAYSLFLM